jgi:hypothetical protein
MDMDVEQLAMKHRLACTALSMRPIEELALWYADLDIRLVGDAVSYRCPECGLKVMMPLIEFLECDSSLQLRCSDCRGSREERGGL